METEAFPTDPPTSREGGWGGWGGGHSWGCRTHPYVVFVFPMIKNKTKASPTLPQTNMNSQTPLEDLLLFAGLAFWELPSSSDGFSMVS